MTRQKKKIEWLTIDEMDNLSPREAGRMIMTEPENVQMTLLDVAKLFGMSGDELKAELTSGRLVAMGTETPTGWTRVHVSVKHLIEWAALTNRVVPGDLN